MMRLEYALGMLASGISLVPIGLEGDKRPAIRWKRYQIMPPRAWEVRSWVRRHGWGIAAVGGAVSGNLEILDFDEAEYFAHWAQLVDAYHPDLVSRLPLVYTPSEGYHLYYRCGVIEGNQKLAQAAIYSIPDQHWIPGKTRIETRGEGGYVVTPASPGACHPSGQRYRLIQGHLWQIPEITLEERACFLKSARAFNEYVELPRKAFRPTEVPTGNRPGDIFAATHSWEEILHPHGWRITGRHGEVTYWKRPEKRDRGQSATTGHNGYDVFYVFSSNAYPFEPRTGYDKFHTWVILNHAGDYHAAAKALVSGGTR